MESVFREEPGQLRWLAEPPVCVMRLMVITSDVMPLHLHAKEATLLRRRREMEKLLTRGMNEQDFRVDA